MSCSHANDNGGHSHHDDIADASSSPTLAFASDGDDDADYVGMTRKSGKIRAKGHLSASVVYILRRYYAAWRVAKKWRTFVTFNSPGAKVLGARIRARYGTDWWLDDDELEVAFLSTVEVVDIAHRRSCRIGSEAQYVSWLDCVSGTPLPRTVGLNRLRDSATSSPASRADSELKPPPHSLLVASSPPLPASNSSRSLPPHHNSSKRSSLPPPATSSKLSLLPRLTNSRLPFRLAVSRALPQAQRHRRRQEPRERSSPCLKPATRPSARHISTRSRPAAA